MLQNLLELQKRTMDNEKQLGAIPWLIKRFRNRREITKGREIRELRLDLEKAKIEKELKGLKGGIKE